LKEILTTEGEKIDPADLETYLTALTGDTAASNQENVYDSNVFMNSRIFAGRILGFEDDS
jgi:hypothetical protein